MLTQGVAEELKDHLAAQDESEDLETLISLSIWLDNGLRERRQQRDSKCPVKSLGSPSGGVELQLNRILWSLPDLRRKLLANLCSWNKPDSDCWARFSGARNLSLCHSWWTPVQTTASSARTWPCKPASQSTLCLTHPWSQWGSPGKGDAPDPTLYPHRLQEPSGTNAPVPHPVILFPRGSRGSLVSSPQPPDQLFDQETGELEHTLLDQLPSMYTHPHAWWLGPRQNTGVGCSPYVMRLGGAVQVCWVSHGLCRGKRAAPVSMYRSDPVDTTSLQVEDRVPEAQQSVPVPGGVPTNQLFVPEDEVAVPSVQADVRRCRMVGRQVHAALLQASLFSQQ